MATFQERFKIQHLARLNPDAPDFTLPPDTTEQEVRAAVALRQTLQAAVADVVHGLFAAAKGSPAAGPQNDQVVWAQKVLHSIQAQSDALLPIVLAEFEDPTATSGQEIRDFVNGLTPVLARGIRK